MAARRRRNGSPDLSHEGGFWQLANPNIVVPHGPKPEKRQEFNNVIELRPSNVKIVRRYGSFTEEIPSRDFREYMDSVEDILQSDFESVLRARVKDGRLTLSEHQITGLTKRLVSQVVAGQPDVGGKAAIPALALPKSWEEAKATVPGLVYWEEAKALAKSEGRRLTIIDHLRDKSTGWGAWTLQEPGLPRFVLLSVGDKAAYRSLNNWLGRDDSETQRPNQIPPDMHLPVKEAWTDIVASHAEKRGELPAHVLWALTSRSQRGGQKK